jgi:phosphoribosylanthranilate isomerase
VKICGLRDAAGAHACVAAGADFVGLNFVPASPRAISEDRAARLLPLLGTVEPVGLFADQGLSHVVAIARHLGLRWLQLHGDETPAYCAALADEFLLIKAVALDRLAAPEAARSYAPHVRALLVDGRQPGSGQTWPWAALRVLCSAPGRLAGVPLWLAGGLDSDNVAKAITAARPMAVDTASGVERDGVWAPDRVAAFCRQARLATPGRD